MPHLHSEHCGMFNVSTCLGHPQVQYTPYITEVFNVPFLLGHSIGIMQMFKTSLRHLRFFHILTLVFNMPLILKHLVIFSILLSNFLSTCIVQKSKGRTNYEIRIIDT
jgi:cytochrome bd-type quinol oxidase subunit 1